ncbi:hypothetical protein RN001_003373 [Aquatica leii]|uniref:Uncharacterized protein n=1 Tax=Aquatica leii TaxID=1421715 RepID=A0AAN7SKQ4_9COLE|nr:hypothetical protein RN001_003373 [Aquatica leii]
MSSTSDTCCKKVGPESCKKNKDGSCTFVKMCTLKTPEGEFPCECICTCKCAKGDCKSCEYIDIPNLTIPQFVFKDFHRFPKKIGVECSVTERKYTFDEIRTKAHNLSKGLRKVLNLKNGDVLAILLPNVPEFPISVLGTLEANLIVTCINPTFSPGEIRNQLLDSNAKAIITLSALCPLLQAAFAEMKHKIPILNVSCQPFEDKIENTISFNELVETHFEVEEIQPNSTNDTAFLLYSSGTTGLPKGVQLSHKNIIANLCQIDIPSFKIAYETTENYQDVIPGILPWFHIAGLNMVMLLYLRYLCKLITMPKFTPELYINILTRHKPSLMPVVPPIVSFMANHPAVKKEYVQCLRAVICGAAPLSPVDEEKIINKTNGRVEVLQAYGLTETSPFVLATSFIRKRELKLKGSIGEVLPNTTVKVVSADNSEGNALGPNEPGELLVKGPQVTKGYHQRADETNSAFQDGWFKTGDLIYYDDNKMFYIQDRLKELIKVKGYQVAPVELENLIRNFPGVEDAAVIGVSNDRYGQVPRAFVVLKSGSKLNTDELISYVSNNVAEYKQLKGGVVIIDAIPKNASGKTLRRQLKVKYDSKNASS